jgi:hypothetical protein
MGIFIALATAATLDGAWLTGTLLGSAAATLLLRGLQECAVAAHGLLQSIKQPSGSTATGRQTVGELSIDET